ncbi:MAG TPA: DUF932 domain-containing protein [Azoarcus taiwanensis]|nr:DUF932 domain-containing protein [Azoarcus taiwanensis]
MAHNIGEMFYCGKLPWHTLGRRLECPATLDEALTHGGLDWEVELLPLAVAGEAQSFAPQRRAVVRKDREPGQTGRVIGVVHPGFAPLQNRAGAQMFDALLGQGQAIYHTGGYLKNGEVVWLLAKLPADIRVRGGDVLETYLLFTNSHDGSIAIDVRLTTVRVVCQNTLSLALHDKSIGKVFRRAHDGRYRTLKEDARAFFAFSVKQSQHAQALFTRMAASQCDDKAFESFLRQLLPDPTRPVTASANKQVERAWLTRRANVQATREQVMKVRHDGIPAHGIGPEDATWWGALNSLTAWVDHVQKTDADRYAHILFGEGDRIKTNALNRIQAIVG